MTDEQVKIFLEFQRKEMELREQKEKIRSQNLTKLNFHKSEIENNQIDLDMKFVKILRKKLHYDTLEQEIYILSLIQFLQRREPIKKQKTTYDTQLKESEDLEILIIHLNNNSIPSFSLNHSFIPSNQILKFKNLNNRFNIFFNSKFYTFNNTFKISTTPSINTFPCH